MPDNAATGKRGWDPDWVISPGETLRDWMEENGLTPRTAAAVCRLERPAFDGILSGRRKITRPIARKLAAGTLISERLWLNLERAYRDGLAHGKVDISAR